MTKRKCGGIETLEDLRQRCYVDEDTGCWHLRTANGKPLPVGDTGEVWSRLHETKVSVPRLAWLLAHPGKEMQKGRMAYRCCTSYDCVAPKHIKAGTKRDWGRMVAGTGRAATAAKVAACRANAANHPQRVITDELKQWIVESRQSGNEIAAVLGCSHSTVNGVRVAHRKAQVSRPAASVFDFAMRAAA